MLVRVLKGYVSRVGPRGAVKDIPDGQARTLLAVGICEKVEPAPVVEEPPKVAQAEKPQPSKRRYTRRDMKAEDDE
jgi:hypothetical protein